MSDNNVALAKSKEMARFYKALAGVQRNSIIYIMSGTDEANIRERAEEVSDQLEGVANEYGESAEGARPCPRGTVYNPVTDQCE